MRVLIAWSNGGNWGHVSRQLALAGQAQALGAEVIWAVPARNAQAMAAVRARGYRVLVHQTPEAPTPQQPSTPRSYADILLRQGFGDAASLATQTVPWLQLYEELQPDRVVIDYAPAAQFATWIAGLPALQLTNGFDSPPAECPPYEAQVRGPYLWQLAAAHVAQVNRTLHEVSAMLSPGTDVDLQALIEYPWRLMDCVAEADPYAERRAPHDRRWAYIGPLGEAPDAAPAQWPAVRRSHRVFAYLRGHHSRFIAALAGVEQSDASVLCVWPDAPDAALARFAADAWVTVTRRPVQAAQALQQADAVLSYGSSTFVCQALLAGKPQLMLPTDHEKLMVGARVAASGLGSSCAADVPDAEVRQRVQALLSDAQISRNAKTVAARYADWHERSTAIVRLALLRVDANASPNFAPTTA